MKITNKSGFTDGYHSMLCLWEAPGRNLNPETRTTSLGENISPCNCYRVDVPWATPVLVGTGSYACSFS